MTPAEFQSRLAERSAAAGVSISPTLVEKLAAYHQLLATWNRRINLTALDLERLPDEALDRLLIEPMAAAQHASRRLAMLDVGSGGGSPAIPFALASEARELTMIESRSRKSVFLREAAFVAGLSPARVLTMRFEEAAASEALKEHFDIVTIRAVRVADEDWPRLSDVLAAGGSVFLLHQPDASCAAQPNFAHTGTHRLTEKSELSIFKRL